VSNKTPDKVTINRSPCVSCPYRRDVPSGIWTSEEYDKILPYDRDTLAQPTSLFMCHQADGSLCRGWLDCHDNGLLAVRLAAVKGVFDADELKQAIVEGPSVPVFGSAAEASAHGRQDIDEPGDDACRLIDKIETKRIRKTARKATGKAKR
jgi:hypothetical protein